MAATLLCYGDLCADVIARTTALPGRGQDATLEELRILPAGSAANSAVTAARLGLPVEFAGLAADDYIADILVRDLEANGVGARHLRRVAGGSGVIISVVDAGGERTLLSYRGVNAFGYGAVPSDCLAAGDCLHLSGYSFQTPSSRRTALAFMAVARERGALCSLDPSFLFAREARACHLGALAGLDFIFPNEEEATLISGRDDYRDAALALRDLGIRTVVVTLGARGCFVDAAGERALVPAHEPTRVIDTTGAGDAFCAGYLAATLHGLSSQSAARVGCVAAAYVVSVPGAHEGAPTLDTLRAALPGETLW